MAVSHAKRWSTATVVEAIDVGDRIRRIVLDLGAPGKVPAGSHLDVRVGGFERSYSIVDASEDGARVALSVLKTTNSRGGSVAMHALEAGDAIEATAPLQDFPLRVGADRYLLVAGGIGITAIASMACVLARLGADYRIVYLGRSREAMAYLDALAAEHGDRPAGHADDRDGRFDLEALLDGIERGTELYMCGPIRLMDAIRRGWLARGLEPTDLRYETFGNSGWFDPEPFTARIPKLGVEVDVGTGESLLEALERSGIEAMYDCRKGECGLCEVTLLEVDGAVDHRDVFLSAGQKSENRTMCCCVSRLASVGDRPARISIELT